MEKITFSRTDISEDVLLQLTKTSELIKRLYYEKVEDALVQEWIKESYQLVASKLPKAIRQKYIQMN